MYVDDDGGSCSLAVSQYIMFTLQFHSVSNHRQT